MSSQISIELLHFASQSTTRMLGLPERLLLAAAEFGSVELANIAILAGANLYTRIAKGEYKGFLPSQYAQAKNHADVANLISYTAQSATHTPKEPHSPLPQQSPPPHNALVTFIEFLQQHNWPTHLNSTKDLVDTLAQKRQNNNVLENNLDADAHLAELTRILSFPPAYRHLMGHALINDILFVIDFYVTFYSKVLKTPLAPNLGTLLHVAAEHGNYWLVRYLIRKGADINSTACEGYETPMMKAARAGHAHVTHALLEEGAKFDSVNDKGHTAFFIAQEHKHTEITEMLKSLNKARAEAQETWLKHHSPKRDAEIAWVLETILTTYPEDHLFFTQMAKNYEALHALTASLSVPPPSSMGFRMK